MIEIASKTNLYNVINNSPQLLILYFTAKWCTPCQVFTPQLLAMENKLMNKVLVIKIDVDQATEIIDTFGISAVPTLVFFQNKRLYKDLTLTGANIGTVYQNINTINNFYNAS